MASRTNECPHFGCYIVGPHDHRSSSGADVRNMVAFVMGETCPPSMLDVSEHATNDALRTALRDCVEALGDLEKCGLGLDLFDPWLKTKLVNALAKARALLGER